MLFLATQTHTPEACPLNAQETGKDCLPLWMQESEKVAIKQLYACPPAHQMFFILEAESFDDIQEFFGPGMTRATVDITPVMDAM